MRSLSVRLLLSLLVLISVPSAFAHDVTLTGTQTFASLDGSSNDHDGSANGVFTVNDGNLFINGVVNCNDDSTTSACNMAFSVSGDVTMSAGSALYAENRSGGGTGGAITITAGGSLALNGNAIVSTASKSSSGAMGGNITTTVGGTVTLAATSTIDAGSSNAAGGSIAIAAGGLVTVDGNVLSGPSRTILASRLTGSALDGGTANQVGGAITISSTTFAEPAVIVGSNANVISQGETQGAGPVIIDGCGVVVRGLVAALSRKDAPAKVAIRSGKDVLIDARDLGVAGGTRNGRIRADAPTGTALNKGVDIFASETIDIYGPAATYFAITSLPGLHDSKSYGGLIRITSLGDAVNASGNVIDDGHSASGDSGGTVEIAAKADVNLNTAVIRAIGDFSTNNPNRGGGVIRVRSFSGDVIWTNGTGEVRPVGSSSNLPLADQGSIVLTACGTVDTTGSSFPVMGTATSVFPETHTGVCSPAAPSLPVGVPPLVTCNTPPVANDTAATTNEDNSVTIYLSGSDVDGDSLTFSIVSGPSNGVLGPIVSTGPTTAEVLYTPNLDYNGNDSFVFQANDGNGGTDNATAVITIAAVNDPPSFLAGASVTVLEDSGAQTFANWVTSISAGPADESGQTVTFTVTNDNPSLFSVQPAVDANGTLTFTAAANASGSATITIVAQDNGGTANGGDDTSDPQTSSITVTGVNDEPSFSAGPNQTVNEDGGPQTVTPWATSISAGPGESGQTLTFIVTTGQASLFSAQPAVAADGTLTYTPAADANGIATVTVTLTDDGGTANGGDDTSAPQTFTITINAVNDAPSFTSGGDVTVLEDSGSYSAAWATAISAGPADESGQSVSFSASNDNNALFSTQPAISSTGVLTFVAAANAFGSATVTVTLSDDGGTANGGDDTSNAQTFTITIDGINDEPTFTAGGDVSVLEDSGAYSAAWASSISAGPGEGSQTVTFTVTNDNNALFSTQPSISATGVLTFVPAADAFGSATVSVTLTDDGGTANGGDDTSATVTFTITVDGVNDAPSFTSGGNVTVNEDSGAYSAAWATAISAGPSNESGQTVAFNILSNSNPSLFSAAPSIDANGVLTFTTAANAFGSATLTVNAQDNGGIANGGADTSATVSFTITINAVNDAPSFTAGPNVTVAEDSGVYSAAWATAISAGPNESGQTLTFNVSNNNNALFASQPAISPAGVLTFNPAPNAFGTATVTVSLSDNGGTANGGVDTSAPVTFTITITGVNDPPAAGNDSWQTLGNTELRVDLGAAIATPAVYDTTTSGTGVLDNDADTVEGDPFTITSIVGCADTTAPFDCTLSGGAKLSMNANGTFTFTPGPGTTAASFQYVVTDAPSAGVPASATGTVTIQLIDMIWYVNPNVAPGGTGVSNAPLNSFASLNGLGDVDDADDYIFVHKGTLNDNIVLEQGQQLWGEGIGLILPHNLNGNGAPAVLVLAGGKPKVIAAASNTVTVASVSGTEIAGLELVSSGGSAIHVETVAAQPAAGTAIYENAISAAAAHGVSISSDSVPATVTVSNTTIAVSGNGINANAASSAINLGLTNVSIEAGNTGVWGQAQAGATLNITALSNVSVSGNTAGDGINLGSATFDADASTATFQTVSGSVSVGAAGNPVGGAGIILTNTSGDLAFGTLPVFATTSGVTITGSALYTPNTAGFRVSSTGGSISAAAGVGLSVSNATIGAANLNFTSITSAGAANGIVLNNTGTTGGLVVSGTGSANSGGSIAGATADAVLLVSARASLTDMSLTNSGQSHIDATNVDGLTLVRMTLDNSVDHGIAGSTVRNLVINGGLYDRGGAASGVANKHGVFINNLLGTSSVTGATFRRSNTIQFRVVNTSATNAFPGAPDTLTVSNTTWDTHTSPFAGDHLSVDSGTGGNLRLVTSGTNNFTTGGVAVQATASGSGRIDLNASGLNTSSNTAGVVVAATATSSGTYSISGNTFTNCGALCVSALNVSTGSLNGTISGNTINGAPSGNGIQVLLQGNGSSAAAVTNNGISGNVGNNGIRAQASAGSGLLALNINNNNVSSTSPFGLEGISIESGSSGAGHANTICLNMVGNTSAVSSGQEGYRLRQRLGTTFNLQNFAGSGTSVADITSWVNVTKANTGTVEVLIGSTFNAASGTCPTP